MGVDHAAIDTEHGARSRGGSGDFLAMMNTTDVVPIVRIPIPDSHYAIMVADAGVRGTLAPYCETVDRVKEAIGAAKGRPLRRDAVRRLIETGPAKLIGEINLKQDW